MHRSRLYVPVQAYILAGLIIGLIFLIDTLKLLALWMVIGILVLLIPFFWWWNKWRWIYIETLNQGLNISRETTYLDQRKYLRWKSSRKLCHRDIAWRCKIRGTTAFGKCDIHHKDGNKWHNQAFNLQALNRWRHQQIHKSFWVSPQWQKQWKFILHSGKNRNKLRRKSNLTSQESINHLNMKEISELFLNLQQWRDIQAKAEKCNPEAFVSDEQLMEMIKLKCRTRTDLLKIEGFTDQQAQKYGPALIK